MNQENTWSPELPVSQVRIARPTNRLDRVVEFYRDVLGLPVIGSFRGHDGYDGVMIGLPGRDYHLEFTSQVDGSPGDVPSAEHLLVLNIPDVEVFERLAARVKSTGHRPVPAENPYWTNNGALTFEDPDGWRVLLMAIPGRRRSCV